MNTIEEGNVLVILPTKEEMLLLMCFMKKI